ncbi:MAG: BolA family protein [Mariprofundaceae bacterium]|nr:BolA family protein [Mariprofundaceae bacterium]
MESFQSLLEQELKATHIKIKDDSASHAGHGATGGHYFLDISSPLFEAKGVLQCHRMVNKVLAHAFQNGEIHALSINIIR